MQRLKLTHLVRLEPLPKRTRNYFDVDQIAKSSTFSTSSTEADAVVELEGIFGLAFTITEETSITSIYI